MRIAIYGRVSTSHQVEHQTIEQQLGRLTAHVGTQAAEGWAVDPAYVFRDDGYSGAALARPGLDRLRDAIKGHEVDRVLVTAPDRLARNYVHQIGCDNKFRVLPHFPYFSCVYVIIKSLTQGFTFRSCIISSRPRPGSAVNW